MPLSSLWPIPVNASTSHAFRATPGFLQTAAAFDSLYAICPCELPGRIADFPLANPEIELAVLGCGARRGLSAARCRLGDQRRVSEHDRGDESADLHCCRIYRDRKQFCRTSWRTRRAMGPNGSGRGPVLSTNGSHVVAESASPWKRPRLTQRQRQLSERTRST